MTTTKPAVPLLSLIGLAAVALAATGCKEAEQDRVLFHEPGVYQGEKDAAIDDETYQDLRQRALRQGG